ncbi:MAG: formylglycine-generating enzyme family protein, partial [Polyangiaceae bacterium]|nr:formylglycine-generating enzyme family protein [Polyangiaceae bacterium]
PPPDGAGAHPLIAGSGWQVDWGSELASSQAQLMSNLKCDWATWRDTASGMEELPINCVTWYETFAFCAWDGGRLPTEAEWEYASAGGADNRLYPWGQQALDSTRASYDCSYDGTGDCAFTDIAPVGSLLAGAGRWGHQDLAGNMYEWVLDWHDWNWYAGGGSLCDNCANLTSASYRVFRGGSFTSCYDDTANLRAASRFPDPPTFRYNSAGVRCARTL